MTDHYSGNDPETGCGIMLLIGASALVVLLLGLTVLALRGLQQWLS